KSLSVPCILCTQKRRVYIETTYSITESKLLPPPYDTDCRDYRAETNYTSKANCFKECLFQFTTQHGFVIEDHLLFREKFENSSLIMAPFKLSDVSVKEGEVGEYLSSEMI